MVASLISLPDEVIQTVLLYLPPTSTVVLQRSCRRLAAVGNEPLLWKEYCKQQFRWWDESHDVRAKYQDPAFLDWKALYSLRHRSSRATRNAVGKLATQEHGHLEWIKLILQTGYDAKDDLVSLFGDAPSSENYLAQRYWSHAALGCLHRLRAVEIWKLAEANDYEILLRTWDHEQTGYYETPLAAFDLFIVGERVEGDVDDIFARLRSYAASVREAHPDIDEWSPRRKAIAIADHLLKNKWTGIQGDQHYHSMDHMFLGVALFSQNRNSVPLISAIIFCYVCRHFNLRAAPCSYPFHVHALVRPPPGVDLDGAPLPDAVDADAGEPSKLTHLYMDPFNNCEPVSLSLLETQLRFIAPNVDSAHTPTYLRAAHPRDLTMRTAHNILAAPSHYSGPPLFPIQVNRATYAAMFCLALQSSFRTVLPERRQHLAVLTQHFLEFFDLDVHLFETHIMPLTYVTPDHRAYRNLIFQLKSADQEARPPKSRFDPRNAQVKYALGQVFRHRRRGYLAVIYGWDPYCRMQEDWINLNLVDRLPQGRAQPFYNALVDEGSARYVAEENVVPLEPHELPADVVAAFPLVIGKWFKNFDKDAGRFVSNLREEYPDD